MRCLRAANVAKLQTTNNKVNQAGFFGTFSTVPVVDGEFTTEPPTQALRRGRVNGVCSRLLRSSAASSNSRSQKALLTMTNTREGDSFVDQRTAATVTAAGYTLRLFPNMGTANAAAVAKLYAGVGTPIDQANAIMGECQSSYDLAKPQY